jgi:imidazole glycerol-phosphate synthase subunit HisF
MLATRVIARLDIKPSLGVVKGVHMEGLRVVGDPRSLAKRYSDAGADELLYVDVTASLYCRNALLDLVRSTNDEVWTPVTVVGGIRSVEDARAVLRAGADKFGINTAAVKRPAVISECAEAFGSQCVVVSIETKRTGDKWIAYTDGGREVTARNALSWAQEAVSLGAGEVLVTSVDREGTRTGYDVAFIEQIAPHVSVPIVASGGAGCADDVVRVIRAGADAVAVGSWLHRGAHIAEIKAELARAGVEVRV